MNNIYIFGIGALLVLIGIYLLFTKTKEHKEEKTFTSTIEDFDIHLADTEDASHSFDIGSAFDKYKKDKDK